MTENEKPDKSSQPPFKRSGDDRRKRDSDRRRANLGKGPGGIDRRRNPGDRRQFLGDRRNDFHRKPKEPPQEYDLRVQDSDDWDKWVRDLGGQKPAS